MEKKIIRTTFFISEFEEQEKWLEVQHKSGWKFVKTDGKRYEFEKCPEEEWVYQLDFKEDDIAEDEYIQMFGDYGWEFIKHYKNWFYFRKKKAGRDEDYSIFSSNESKIEMCKRVIKGQFLKTVPLPVFLLAAVYYFVFFTGIIPKNSLLRGESKYDLIQKVQYDPKYAWEQLECEARRMSALGAKYILVHFPYFKGEASGCINELIEEGLEKLSYIQINLAALKML